MEGRYNSAAGYFKRTYGERLQKLVVDAGFTCPNRDGTKGRGGCTFCDNAAFHPGYSTPDKPIRQQLDEGIEFHRLRYPRARHYLAYFQPFTNTYAPLERLRSLYLEALSHPSVTGLVIGTRPDCVDEEILDFLADLKDGKILRDWRRLLPGPDGSGMEVSAPLLTLEYGIESCNDQTLRRINRCHDFACARKAVALTSERGIDCGAHFILGLPGETRQMLLSECDKISALPLRTVKFHQLQLVKGTRMEREFAEKPADFLRLGLDDYLDLITDMLERLRPSLCIERIAGEVPPRFLGETQWGLLRNVDLIRRLEARLEERDTFQGRLYRPLPEFSCPESPA